MPQARDCHPGPLSPGAYKYPFWVLQRIYPEFRSYCYLSLGVIVILFLGVVVVLFPSSSSFSLAIRVKERVCKSCI